MIEHMFPFLPLEMKCHKQPPPSGTPSSTCADGVGPADSSSTAPPATTFPSTQLQQPLSSTTSNIPHTTSPPSASAVAAGNINNNCSPTDASSAGNPQHHQQNIHHHSTVGHHPSMGLTTGPNHPHRHHHHAHNHQDDDHLHHHHHHHNNSNNNHHHHHHHHHHPAIHRTASISAAVLAALCGSCCGPISDRYIMRVVDAFYHEDCLQCTSCAMQLRHSCFARNGKLYCRMDYERIFLKNRCLGCGERIGSDELVMRTADNVFHLKCFSCVVCGVQLQKGEQYVVKQSQLFCRSDYEKEVEMLQGFNDFVDDYFAEDVFPSKVDGRRGPKRPRTILNTQQRRAFKASFDVSPKPCRKVRETLAKETGLSLRIVQVWFQNQRAKVKKIQKKARQDHHNRNAAAAKSCSESESIGESSLENETKIKDENESDTESYINGNLDPDHNKSTIKEEQENDADECYRNAMFLGSSLGYKDLEQHRHHMATDRVGASAGGVFGVGPTTTTTTTGDSGAGIHLSTLMGLTYSAFQQLMTTAPAKGGCGSGGGGFGGGGGGGGGGLTFASAAAASPSPSGSCLPAAHIPNPIDRLYSMQNAYFRCDEAKGNSHSIDELGN